MFRTPLLQALIGLFELPEDDSIPDDEHFVDIEDAPGYQTAFSQLAFAGKKEHDPIGDSVGNPKILLAQSLYKLSTACPGRVCWTCGKYLANHNNGLVRKLFLSPNVRVQDRLRLMYNHYESCFLSQFDIYFLSFAGSLNAEYQSECRGPPVPAGLLTGRHCAVGLS